jgi:hypothetical protein
MIGCGSKHRPMLTILVGIAFAGSPQSTAPYASKLPRAPSATSLDDTDPTDESGQSNIPAIIGVVVMLSVVVGIGCYVYLRRKWDEAANPEYTRAILGDDAYEFSELETL